MKKLFLLFIALFLTTFCTMKNRQEQQTSTPQTESGHDSIPQQAAPVPEAPVTEIPAPETPVVETPEKPWQIIIAFAPADPSPDDWNEAWGKIHRAFDSTGIQLKYTTAPKVVVGPAQKPQTVLDIGRFIRQYEAGYLVAEENKNIEYIGDHAGFFDADETTDPVTAAKKYFNLK